MSSNEAEYWKHLLEITNSQRNAFIQRHKNRLAAGDETASDELTYGELTLDGCFALLDDAQMRSATTERGKPYKFLDLGSGTGKLIFAAIRVLPELRGVGVELSLERHAAACEVRSLHIQHSPTFNYTQRLTLINGDASCAVGPISWADTIWISNLLFPSWLNERIAQLIDLWAEQDTLVYSQKPLPLHRRYPDWEDECVLCNVTWQQAVHLVKVDMMCGVPPACQLLREPASETTLEECFSSWVDRSQEQLHRASEQTTNRPSSIIPNLDVLKAALSEALLRRISSENLIKRLYADDGDLHLICSQAFLRSRRHTRHRLGTGGVDLATFTDIFKSCEERLTQSKTITHSPENRETMQQWVEALPEETVEHVSPSSEAAEEGSEKDNIGFTSFPSKAAVNIGDAPPPEFLSFLESLSAKGKTSSSRSTPKAQPKLAAKANQPLKPKIQANGYYPEHLSPARFARQATNMVMMRCEDEVDKDDNDMPENLHDRIEEAWPSLGPRVRKLLRTYPYFEGELPAEEAENEWSDRQLDAYFASNGFIAPKQGSRNSYHRGPR